ncbi:MAG: TIGR00366 family protein [Gammaproteobacteria bacterium]|nr:TIGR00366 family protein [Gammaproteobacteria bacterium]
MRFFQILARPFVVFVERYYPDPFVFVVLLSALTFLLSLLLADATPAVALSAWGDGLPSLLAFTAQICITLLTAHALAHTDRVQVLLKRIGNIPNSAAGAYALVAFSAGIGSLIAWSLGLIVGATVAREVARQCSARGIRIHYPLLVASAYAGFVIWHMGYSSSAGLFVATAGHSLEAEIGIIPITETVFTLHNGVLALITLAVICMVCPLMRPDERELLEIDPALLEEHVEEPAGAPERRTFAKYLDAMRPLSLLLGAGLFCYIGYSFYARGFHLNLNLVNWSFLGAGLLLARSPSHYVRLINNASSTIGPVLIQYPFYAGILGMMQGTGLAGIISDWFTSIATPETLSFFAFLCAGLVNMFIPSGGGQWAVQGPIFIEAGQNLGVDPSIIVLAISYGDQWTNMIQPFWTIPLLAIAGLHMRQIMGYTFVIFLLTLFLFGGGLLLWGAG